MPFTLAHSIIALPLSRLKRYKLPIAGLVIGSMTPDLYRLFYSNIGLHSHSFYSIFHLNLILGLVLSLLWYWLYRPALYQIFHLTDSLHISNIRALFTFFSLLCFFLVFGSFTHVFWDTFTHFDDRNLFYISILKEPVLIFGQNYPLYFILQILCSIFPLPILYFWCKKYYKDHHQPQKRSTKTKQMIVIGLILILLLGFLNITIYLSHFSIEFILQHFYYFFGRILNKFTQAFLLIFSLYSLYWKYQTYKNSKWHSAC